MAYRADIEIAVRGAAQITNLQKQLQGAASGVDLLNSRLRSGAIPSINNFNAVVTQSDRILRAAAQGTRVQKDAIDVYVRSVAAAEKAEKSLQNAIQKRRQELGISAPARSGASGGAGKGISGRIGGAISGAAIGGAFPLLFGQGGGAATGGAIGGLAGGLLGPGGSFAGSLVGTLIGDIASKGQKVKELGQDIGFSAEQTNKLQQAFKLAGQDADKFTEAVQNIRGVGLAVEDQAKAIDLVSKLTNNFGGSVVKTTNAITGALESGKVTQATLNQLTSQGIPIQDALAKKYNTNRDNLLKMAKDGKISVQDLIDTLVEVGNKSDSSTKKAKSGFDVLSAAAQGLGSAIGNLAGSIVTRLTPVFNWIFSQLTQVFNLATAGLNAINAQLAAGRAGALNRNISSAKIAGNVGATSESVDQATRGIRQLTPQKNKTGIEQNLNAIEQYVTLLQTVGSKDKNVGARAEKLQGVLSKLKSENLEALKNVPTTKTVLESFKAPSQAAPSGGSDKAGKDAERAAAAAAKEAERVQEVIRTRLAEGQIIKLNSTIQDKIAAAELARDPMLVARLKGAQKELDIQYKYAQALAQEKDIRAQQAIIFEGQNALTANQRDTQLAMSAVQRQADQDRFNELQKVIEQQYKLNTAVQQQLALSDAIAQSVGQGLTSAFNALIQGSESFGNSLQKIASGVLIDIANQLLRIFVIEQAINAIKTFITPFSAATPMGAGGGTIGKFGTLGPNYGIRQRAKGGPVSGGTPYMVGERGPELFVPGSSGTIVPNNAMGGGSTSVVVNVDASGSNVQGNEQEGKQLGKVLAAAVQAELIKQKRPGGLLA